MSVEPGTRRERPRIGLALAGGGPQGAVYEIGALRALEEAVGGLALNEAHVYVGVSAGAFVGACLANGITSSQLVRGTVREDPGEHPFVPETVFTPAVSGIVARGLKLPRLVAEAVWEYVRSPGERSIFSAIAHLGGALPLALFEGEPIRAYLEEVFSREGRTDDFRELAHPLYVVAADLDSGSAVRFGAPGFDHVPISRAVQASAALPGLYSPVEIDGRHYVDGVLLKTLHASVALDAGADLVICVNPIVPVDTRLFGAAQDGDPGRLVDRGVPVVLSQTFRTLVHSRLVVGLASYGPRYPGQEYLLIEPPRDDHRMFFTNVFSFSARRDVCEHAYRTTLRLLRERRAEFEPLLARHGLEFRDEVLADPERSLWRGVGLDPAVPTEAGGTVAARLDAALSRLETHLERREAALDRSPVS